MARDIDTSIREEKIKFLDKGHSEKEADAMAFLTVFEKADDEEKQILAPMFNQLTEKYELDQEDWKSLEQSVRMGGRNTLDPYGYGIEMTSPLGKMIS